LISPRLTHQAITFTATTVGTRDPSLMLTDLVIHTSTATGVHIVHPLWAVWNAADVATPDAVDSFSGLDLAVPPNETAPIGPGILILPHYIAGERINVAFAIVEPAMPAPPGMSGPTLGCKAVAAFTQAVQPTLEARCAVCHAGLNPNATAAFDLGGISDLENATQIHACANTLGEVDLMNPAVSRIYAYVTEGSGIVHPFKLGSDDLEQFRRSADSWINQER
jgi:hypothetical protein